MDCREGRIQCAKTVSHRCEIFRVDWASLGQMQEAVVVFVLSQRTVPSSYSINPSGVSMMVVPSMEAFCRCYSQSFSLCWGQSPLTSWTAGVLTDEGGRFCSPCAPSQ